MAKTFEGNIKLASAIAQTGAQPLDDRVVVKSLSDLYDSFGTAHYLGMQVVVTDEEAAYILINDASVASADGWKKVGDGAGAIQAANYTAALAYATNDNKGQIIYALADEGTKGQEGYHAAGPYIVTGASSISYISTSTGTGADLTERVSSLETKVGDTAVSTQISNAIQTNVTDKLGVASGIATLDSNAKLVVSQLPDFILGQMMLGGTVSMATATQGLAIVSANLKSKLGISDTTIQLINSADDVSTATPKQYGYETLEGCYFIVSDAGEFGEISFESGDWLVAIGTAWKKIDNSDAVTSVNGKTGAVVIDASDVGLGNVDNTSDANKPVSTAQQSAIDAAADAVKNTIVGDASSAYDTLGKLQAKLAEESEARALKDSSIDSSINDIVKTDGTIDSRLKAAIEALDAEVENTAASAGEVASAQIKVKVAEVDGKLTTVTVTAPSFESAGAAATVKSEVIGQQGDVSTANTIYGAKAYADAVAASIGTTIIGDGRVDASKQSDGWHISVDASDLQTKIDSTNMLSASLVKVYFPAGQSVETADLQTVYADISTNIDTINSTLLTYKVKDVSAGDGIAITKDASGVATITATGPVWETVV